MTVRIEDGGRILRGMALPFDEPALVKINGQLAEEVFDERSFDSSPEGAVPLLINHERRREPIGVARTPLRNYGLSFEAELIVSDSDLEVWRRRFEAGLVSGVSVAYLSDPRRFEWERPTQRGRPPIVRPRGVDRVDELSLILSPNLPAYDHAQVSSLSLRSAADQRRHEESDRIIAWWRHDRAVARGREILAARASGVNVTRA